MNLCIFGRIFFFFLVGACLIEYSAPNASAQYTVTNLVANETYLNPLTQDPGLINAWGLADQSILGLRSKLQHIEVVHGLGGDDSPCRRYPLRNGLERRHNRALPDTWPL